MTGREVRHKDGRVIDVADMTSQDQNFLAALHRTIGPGDHVLECLTPGGTDPWLYVYRHDSGAYYPRHFPGGAHDGCHLNEPQSPQHHRAKEYGERLFSDAGIPAAQEVSTNNHTRLDVATLEAPVITALEVHFGSDARQVKTRNTMSSRATAFTGRHARPLSNGVMSVWLSPDGARREWLYAVPSVGTTMDWAFVPPKRSVMAYGTRTIEATRCRDGGWNVCPLSGRGWCRGIHPKAVPARDEPLDDVLIRAASGLLVPLRYHNGAVYLVSAKHAELYAELGGAGTYQAGKPARGRASLLGPCQNARHALPAARLPADEAAKDALRNPPAWLCAQCSSATRANEPCQACGSSRLVPMGMPSHLVRWCDAYRCRRPATIGDSCQLHAPDVEDGVDATRRQQALLEIQAGGRGIREQWEIGQEERGQRDQAQRERDRAEPEGPTITRTTTVTCIKCGKYQTLSPDQTCYECRGRRLLSERP